MKNTVRIHRNPSAANSTPQAETDSPRAIAPGANREKLSDAICELERAENQSFALMHLLADSFIFHAEVGPWSDEFASQMSGALLEILGSTAKRLNRAVDQTREAAFPGVPR